MKKKAAVVMIVTGFLLSFCQSGYTQPVNTEGMIGFGARVSYVNLTDDDLGGVDVEFDDAPLYGLNLTYFFSNILSFELAVEHVDTNLDLRSSDTFLEFGEVSQTSILLSARSHIPTDTMILPYLGVGGGYYFNEFDFSRLVPTALAQTNVAGAALDPDNSFGFFVTGGLEFFLLDNFVFNIDLKYVWNSIDFDLSATGFATQAYEIDMDAFIVGIGAKLYF